MKGRKLHRRNGNCTSDVRKENERKRILRRLFNRDRKNRSPYNLDRDGGFRSRIPVDF